MSENVVELQPYADVLDSPKDMFSHAHKDTHVVALGRSLSLYSRNSKCRKKKTMPFGVNLLRSQVLYRAAHHSKCTPS